MAFSLADQVVCNSTDFKEIDFKWFGRRGVCCNAAEGPFLKGRLEGIGQYSVHIPKCSALLNQPCRTAAGTVPGGSLALPDR